MRKHVLLIIVIIIASILRLWQLGNIPYGIANDEASYIYSAYTVWKTGGHDIHGNFLPLSFNVDSSLSPVPVYLTAPFVGLLGVSPFSGRLPFAILGIGSVFLIFLLVKKLFDNEKIAFIAALVLAVSPWHLLLTRSTWDGVSALFFYLLGFYIFVSNVRKTNILWSIPVFVLGFYSYHATKVFFLFLIPFLVIVYFHDLWKNKRQLAIIAMSYILILVSFILVIKLQGVTRQNELIWSDDKSMAPIVKTVNYQREKSSAPSLLKSIYSNKPTQLGITILDQYLSAFSPQYLFLNGDIGSVTGYGYFLGGAMYIIDIPLLLLGLLFLTKNKSKTIQLLVIGGLLIAPLPAAFASTKTYVIRAIMMLPFLSILVGLGLYYFLSLLKNKLIRNIGCILITVVYLFFVSRFLYQYVFQFSTYAGEFWNKSNREVATYILSHKEFHSIKVFSANNKTLLQYALLGQVDPHQFRSVWEGSGIKEMDHVTFEDNCPSIGQKSLLGIMPSNSLYVVKGECIVPDTPTMKIVDSLEPLRVIWNIYEKH